MSFLKAEWRKLAMANYEVEHSLLSPYLPAGTEFDFWNNRCYVSLVGFMFINTRLLAVKIPFHAHFEEVNLRFYVRRWEKDTWRRGVVFIKELVPKQALTFVANVVYKEHYETWQMNHRWLENNEGREVEYRWRKNSNWNTFAVHAGKVAQEIPEGSEEEFITEHYWGYTRINKTTTYGYEVRHPRWKVYEVKNHTIDVNFGSIYGDNFSFLTTENPASVMLAEGSEISVERKSTLRI